MVNGLTSPVGALVFAFCLFLIGAGFNYFGSNPRILYFPLVGICLLVFFAGHFYIRSQIVKRATGPVPAPPLAIKADDKPTSKDPPGPTLNSSGPNSPNIVGNQNQVIILPTPQNKPDRPDVALFIDCVEQMFPIQIPAGDVIHVLRVHPQTIKANSPLFDARAPLDKPREWPSDADAAPLPLRPDATYTVHGFLGYRCTVRKLGDPTLDKVMLQFDFSGWAEGSYRFLIDPLQSQGPLSEFTFYILNACYKVQEPHVFKGRLPPITAKLPEKALVHVLGEPDNTQREVRVRSSVRGNTMSPMILLPEPFRQWSDLAPSL